MLYYFKIKVYCKSYNGRISKPHLFQKDLSHFVSKEIKGLSSSLNLKENAFSHARVNVYHFHMSVVFNMHHASKPLKQTVNTSWTVLGHHTQGFWLPIWEGTCCILRVAQGFPRHFEGW